MLSKIPDYKRRMSKFFDIPKQNKNERLSYLYELYFYLYKLQSDHYLLFKGEFNKKLIAENMLIGKLKEHIYLKKEKYKKKLKKGDKLMTLFNNEDYEICLIEDCLPKITFYFKNHKTGEILVKEFNNESFIKKIFSKNIIENADITDLFV